MQFLFPSLTWGFLLVLAPLLIHLINLLRHRRVRWAAMDFLLQSYKRHRRWVWLRQFLLLAARMAAIALLVAMLAQWITQDRWFAVFGGRATHHLVLLDDSYSMGEQFGESSAFDTARRVLMQLAAQASQQETPQKFTLLRFSRAQLAGSQTSVPDALEQIADFNAELVDADFDLRMEERRNTLEVTQLDVSPNAALRMLQQLVDRSQNEKLVTYVVSDFRAKDWNNPVETKRALDALERKGVELHLVSCVAKEQPNLGVVAVEPADETRAAGVPLFVNVSVKNFGRVSAQNVQLKVQTSFFDPTVVTSSTPGQLAPRVQELPTVMIEQIEPGSTVTRRVQVFFPRPGQHVIEALLPEDSLPTDNRRWCVVELAEGEPVLLVDGTLDQRHAYYLRSVFAPGARAATGVLPQVQSPAFLRDTPLDQLQRYYAIYLLDVPRLDERAVQNLEEYVRGGGGLGIFMGDQVSLSFYNQTLYRNGEGLLPVPLERPDALPAEPDPENNAPDVLVGNHPVFEVFQGERNPLLRTVSINKYLKLPSDWKPPADVPVNVIARLRNQAPLVVERTWGEGRVVVFLTSIAPSWSTWALDPSFVVVGLKLQSYLAASHRTESSRQVGTPLEVELDGNQFQKELAFVIPGENPSTRIVIQRVAEQPQPDLPILNAVLGVGQAVEGLPAETGRQGIYEAWPRTIAGELQVQRWALNVEPDEGDLALAEPNQVLQKLSPVEVQFHQASDYEYGSVEQAAYTPSLFLMLLLVGLLLIEQALGYSASYHPPVGAVR